MQLNFLLTREAKNLQQLLEFFNGVFFGSLKTTLLSRSQKTGLLSRSFEWEQPAESYR